MRDQYAGDVSDVVKFAFLRALSGSDRKLGLAWYYAPGDDGRPDGRHREWLTEPAWRRLDENLVAGLSAMHERSVAHLEQSPIWPKDTAFHRTPVPPHRLRSAWAEAMRADLGKADLLFLDPDNGLGASTKKHATTSEISRLRRPGRSIAFITFPGRHTKHEDILIDLHQRLTDDTGTGPNWMLTLRTSVSTPSRVPGTFIPRARWFTVIDANPNIIKRAAGFAAALNEVPRVIAQIDRPIHSPSAESLES